MTIVHAAAVLVMNGPRVLAFKRYNEDGLSLPCGKIEPGETPAQAAVREALEETGLEVRIVNATPFSGFDAVGNAFVTTFLAEIVGGKMLSTPTNEGTPVWAGISTVAHGPFWHYNQRMLRHFGHKVPLAGKFHSHITITAASQDEADRAAKLTGGKLTVISLSRLDQAAQKTQTDFMITHHYVTGVHGLEDQNDIVALLKSRGQLLVDSGVRVDRLKLEYDVTHPRNASKDAPAACAAGIYTEIHIKCLVAEDFRKSLLQLATDAGWHPSRNPYATSPDGRLVQFVNRRFYGDVTLSSVDAEVDRVVPSLLVLADIEEIKYETAVFDTNEEHDKWWMAK